MIEVVSWEHPYTMDPIPQQDPARSQVYPFFEHLRQGKLTTTRCRACGRMAWPPRTVCPACLSTDLEWMELPGRGRLAAVTVQVSGAPPGFPLPMVFAAVEITPEIRFVGRVLTDNPETVQSGMTVELVVHQVPDGRVLPAFRVVTPTGDHAGRT